MTMNTEQYDERKLADLVHAIAAEVASDPSKSFNTFVIAYRLSWDEQAEVRQILSDRSEAYYDGLEAGHIDVGQIQADVRVLRDKFATRFDWTEKITTDLLRSCVKSGMLRGFCSMALDLQRASSQESDS